MNDLIREIQARRQVNADQALGLLAIAASSDTKTKKSMLGMVSRSLADSKVQEKWIEVCKSENDTEIKREMLLHLCFLDPRRFININAFIDLLFESIEDPEIQNYLIYSLVDLATIHPKILDKLVEIYPNQKKQSTQWLLLLTICNVPNLDNKYLDFLLNTTKQTDEYVKLVIVDVLLRRDKVPDAHLEKWLDLTEPETIQYRVMNYLLDRSKILEKPLTHIIQNSPNPYCRTLAIQTISANRKMNLSAVQTLIKTAREDAEESVKKEALDVLGVLDLTPELTNELISRLKEEKSAELVKVILNMLRPALEKSPEVRQTLEKILQENLRVDVAVSIYDDLEKLFTNQPDLLTLFIKAFEEAKDDRIKAVSLRALSKWDKPDLNFIQMYLHALQSPVADIVNWAANGILTVPATTEYSPHLAASVHALLNKDLKDPDTFAQKLSILTEWDPDSFEKLRKVSDQTDKPKIKKATLEIIDKIQTKKTASGEKVNIDWEDMYKRVASGNDEGIFPELFTLYDDSPEQVIRIAKASVLRSKDTYNKKALAFIVLKGGMDEDLIRFCWSQILNGNIWLINALRIKPGLSNYREELWQTIDILKKHLSSETHVGRYFLLEMLREAYAPSEKDLIQDIEKHLRNETDPKKVQERVEFLIENRGWLPTKNLIKDFYIENKNLNDDTKKAIEKELKSMNVDLSAVAKPVETGGGLADD